VAADVEIRIGAELTEIKGALAALRRDLGSVGQAAQQAGGRNALSGLESGARNAVGAIGRLVGSFAALATAIKLIGAADELNTLNSRLKLVTSSNEEFARAQAKVFDLAQRTRTSLGETISLYTRIAQATKDAGVGQETLLGVVETINQAVQLSGASTQAAEAALIQLGQGLASGALRGEELNSVLEQTPALADAIAKGLGKTRGELRQLGQDGKLTAEQVLKALQSQREEVARQFATLPLTVGQSVTLLKNAGLQKDDLLTLAQIYAMGKGQTSTSSGSQPRQP
jgi:tape measure domain-containing protein